jgi:hypothetical protein
LAEAALERESGVNPLLAGHAVGALLDLRARESIGLLRRIHRAGGVDLTVCGNLLQIERELGFHPEALLPSALPSSLGAKVANLPLRTAAALSLPGRNDPCPCGSGRKDKHCCLGR